MTNITKGSKVQVFHDPVACTKREGVGTVTKVLRVEDWNDCEGNPITRCNVRFPKESSVYERDVSRLAVL